MGRGNNHNARKRLVVLAFFSSVVALATVSLKNAGGRAFSSVVVALNPDNASIRPALLAKCGVTGVRAR
jgi:hypothetical protein